MKDHLRHLLIKNNTDPRAITHITNNRDNRQICVFLDQLLFNHKKRCFGIFKKNQFLWIKTGNLTTNFTANTSTCPCNKNPFPMKIMVNLCFIQKNCFPSQQVIQIYISNLLHRDPSINQLTNPGKNSEPDIRFPTVFDNLPDLRPRCRRYRNDNFIHTIRIDNFSQINT